MKTKKWTTLLLILIAVSLSAQVKLPPMFNNNMVLQQGMEIPVLTMQKFLPKLQRMVNGRLSCLP